MADVPQSKETVTLTIEAAESVGLTCAAEGCSRKVTCIAAGRGQHRMPLDFYCDTHGDMAAEQESPEYIGHCPNCGCRFGVN